MLREIESVEWGGLVFGPRYIPGTPFLVSLPQLPPYPECCLVHHSNLALGHGPELLSPAPLKSKEGKGQPEHCGRRWLHAHENLPKAEYIFVFVQPFSTTLSLLLSPLPALHLQGAGLCNS